MKTNLFRVSFAAAMLAVPALSLHAGSVVTWGSGIKPVPMEEDPAREISVSLAHALALRQDGTVAAWGYNFNGQCSVPAGLTSVRGVAAGQFFSVAVRSNGTVVVWGDNMHGQCEIPSGLGNVIQVSAGNGHVLALRSDGSLRAWGDNAYGQTNIPTSLGVVTAIRAAGNYNLAVRANGTVAAWGDNSSGQTNVPPGLSGVTAVAGNLTFCLARKSDGTVTMWGRGPQVPQGLSQVIAVAAGEDHALALKTDGSIAAWGGNQGGQLLIPPTLVSASSIAAGWRKSAAISGQPDVVFAAFSPSWAAGVFSVSVPTQQGFSYRLEYKNSLSDASWTPLPSVSGTGGPVTLSDVSAAANQRCYRVARF